MVELDSGPDSADRVRMRTEKWFLDLVSTWLLLTKDGWWGLYQ
jgi:hypothetical protein